MIIDKSACWGLQQYAILPFPLTFPSMFGSITPTAPGLQFFLGQSITAGLVSVRPYPKMVWSNKLIKSEVDPEKWDSGFQSSYTYSYHRKSTQT